MRDLTPEQRAVICAELAEDARAAGRVPIAEVFAGMPIQARIVIEVLPDGRACLSSTCMGRPDSSYAPMADERVGAEVQVLLAEMRQRLAGVSRS